MEKKKFYLGLDIGTDSVGYAVTDKEYNLLKFHGEPAWGVTVFDEASLCDERRSFRTARRRLDRRQQRVTLIQELFAPEVSKIDERFFIRLKESAMYREDVGDSFTLFNDDGFTDKEYYEKYPTIHHLISDLMESDKPHDVRLVYLAVAWLVAHRGHFLSNIDKSNLDSVKDFSSVYDNLISYFTDNEYAAPWAECDKEALGNILKKKLNITNKYKELTALLYGGKKPSKSAEEEFPFSRDAIVRLLAGGTVKLKDLFDNEDYDEFGSVALGMDDEKLGEIMSNIGDDYDLIDALRAVYDWSVLVDALGESEYISKAKVKIYEQHKADLAFLKHIIKKYKPEKYNEVFRDKDKDNYTSYSYHSDDGTDGLKKKNKELFSKYILGLVKGISPDESDAEKFSDMLNRLELRTFMPKQKDTDNRVIPHQLYWYELHRILEKAVGYLPFLAEKDESGLTVADKIESVFLFRIPYYVGPLNSDSDKAWLIRKAGKIYPWNFEEMVDLDESENQFIKRMTNKCTYLPGEDVLPKDSLLYHKFSVLNAINNLRINGEKISVELKQRIYNEVFMLKKKVTLKFLTDYLIKENIIEKGTEDCISGVDTVINANLVPQIAFRQLLDSGILTQDDAERIIERASYAEDKTRLAKWLAKNYPQIDEKDRKYICSMKIKDFGRLSRKLLAELEGVDKSTGEVTTVIGAMWNTQNNLMEIIADEEKYTFAEVIRDFCQDYYNEHKPTLAERLDEMYISNSVRRPIYRTLDIVKDVVKAFGKPEKIFVEMTRGATEEQKGKRTKTRKQQILELYEKCKDEDVRLLKSQLEAMGDYADNRLQGDKLFLYFMQLGKSMYSGKPIDLDKLGTKEYDIDHIYPQAFVKDDSIINNKVLVLSEENGAKSDSYPINPNTQHQMRGYWDYLNGIGLISDEKYKRLVRATPFTDDEKYGFINRQLTETSQSTKAVATLLNEKYPETEIVYCKAKLASEFRQEFDLYKSRTFNDLHHAVDAYLNIVTGNVYNMKFSKRWFSVNSKYSIKTKTLFTHPLVCGNETVWDGEDMLAKVKKTAVKNNAHFTKFAYYKKGGLFDQMPVPAAEGLVPLKKDLPTEKYGGYNKAGAMFYIPVRYKAGKKSEIIIMSVELLFGKRFLSDSKFAEEYTFARLKHIIGKDVDEISFPMGMRPWKVNTVLSLDGFRVCIAGTAGGGKCLIAQPVMQFSADKFWKFYLKKLEEFVKKISANENHVYSEQFDKISKEKNIELYDLYLDKLENSIFTKRVNCPVAIVRNGKDTFVDLNVKEQAKALLNIHQIFGRISGGVDLTSIGGKGSAAATKSFSSTISNWSKNYKDVRIIDSSASGLWEKESCNLLELL
ncbi:MAG: type II CRISPR RNA-guided endonuclease Cas9 [Acutalibacteraceae bacterium]